MRAGFFRRHFLRSTAPDPLASLGFEPEREERRGEESERGGKESCDPIRSGASASGSESWRARREAAGLSGTALASMEIIARGAQHLSRTAITSGGRRYT
jgi:hypothetical protein